VERGLRGSSRHMLCAVHRGGTMQGIIVSRRSPCWASTTSTFASMQVGAVRIGAGLDPAVMVLQANARPSIPPQPAGHISRGGGGDSNGIRREVPSPSTLDLSPSPSGMRHQKAPHARWGGWRG